MVKEVALVPPFASGRVPVNVIFGEVPPLEAMFPEPVTEITQVEQVNTPVEEVYPKGEVADKEVELTLLLKVVQSPARR